MSEALALEQAIAAGLGYILSRQAGDGSWTDWDLPPGSSAPWTTAYVGYKLRTLPPDLKARAAPHLAAAARWLADQAFPDGGWGYNALVGPDADSTAHAILFLASVSQPIPLADATTQNASPVRSTAVRPVPEAAYARLASFQNPDGGFATYLRTFQPNSWNASHPDITPMALLALLTHPAGTYREPVRQGMEYVLRQRTASGLWHSFWWRSCLYGTEASLALLDADGLQATSPAAPFPATLAQIEPDNAFEVALLLSGLLYGSYGPPGSSVSGEPRPAIPSGARDIARDLAGRLVREQQSDGSWPSAPILRITRRDCYDPWACGDAGPLYADPHRLFTTATAVHALGRICAKSAKSCCSWPTPCAPASRPASPTPR